MDDLDGTYGALFVGVLLSAVYAHLSLRSAPVLILRPRSNSLFGVTVLQAFVYLQQYPADSAWRKLAVYWLWCVRFCPHRGLNPLHTHGDFSRRMRPPTPHPAYPAFGQGVSPLAGDIARKGLAYMPCFSY